MNLNKLIIISGIALTAIAVPAADAQRGHRGGGSRGGISRPNIASSSARGFQSRAGRGSGQFSANRGARFRNGSGRGHHWNGNRWGHRRGHYRGYSPYYSYYPYGYGYGYPFFGTSLYFSNGYSRYSNSDGGSVVAAVQQELARAGYYRGTIDGIAGSGTRSAIRQYERATGLPVDGRIDSDLLSAMGIG